MRCYIYCYVYLYALSQAIEHLAAFGTSLLESPFAFHRPIAPRTKADYKQCLSKRVVKHKVQDVSLVPEGSDIRLSCGHLCLPPKKSVKKLWRYSPPKLMIIKPVNLKKVRYHISHELFLEIKSVTLDDTGTYYCIHNKKILATHIIDVVSDEPMRIILDPRTGLRSKGKPLDTWELTDNNLKLSTKWTDWSSCSRCDKVGLRKRIGICTVYKLNDLKPTKPIQAMGLNFGQGIPCRSFLLPPGLSNIDQVKRRSSETMYSFCNVSCPKGQLEFIRDSSGRIIETVDHSQGLYSFKQKLPALPKFVRRELVYKDEGLKVVLGCPGDTSNKFIQWRNGTYVLNPLSVHRRSKGRIKIDYLNQLHVRQLRLSDTAVYSCWENNKLIGTIKMVVESRPHGKWTTELLKNLGTYFLIFIILTVGLSIFRNRNLPSKF